MPTSPSKTAFPRLIRCALALTLLLPACHSPQPVLPHAAHYDHTLRNANQEWLEKGEHLQNGIKDGEWRQYDAQGQLSSIQTYRHDTLQGEAAFIHYDNPGAPILERGQLCNGIRCGEWQVWNGKGDVDEEGNCHWRHKANLTYDPQGNCTTMTLLFPNGKPEFEFTYGPGQVQRYYRQLNRHGKVVAEGEKPPIEVEIR